MYRISTWKWSSRCRKRRPPRSATRTISRSSSWSDRPSTMRRDVFSTSRSTTSTPNTNASGRVAPLSRILLARRLGDMAPRSSTPTGTSCGCGTNGARPSRATRALPPWLVASHVVLGRHPAVFDRLHERGVVESVLIGVRGGEAAQRFAEGVSFAEVTGDARGVAGAGVGSGEGSTTQLCVGKKGVRRQGVDVGGHLHVAQVAPVVVDTGSLVVGPSEEHVACGLHEPLSLDGAAGVIVVGGAPEVRREPRRLAFLDLQDERVDVPASCQHGDAG